MAAEQSSASPGAKEIFNVMLATIGQESLKKMNMNPLRQELYDRAQLIHKEWPNTLGKEISEHLEVKKPFDWSAEGVVTGRLPLEKEGEKVSIPDYKMGKCKLELSARAEGLAAKDINGKSDPYLKFEWQRETITSKVCDKTLSPDWGKILSSEFTPAWHRNFNLKSKTKPKAVVPKRRSSIENMMYEPEEVYISFFIFDKDRIGKDEDLGSFAFDPYEEQEKCFQGDGTSQIQIPVTLEGASHGVVTLDIRFKPPAGYLEKVRDYGDYVMAVTRNALRKNYGDAAKARETRILLNSDKGYLSVHSELFYGPESRVVLHVQTSVVPEEKRQIECWPHAGHLQHHDVKERYEKLEQHIPLSLTDYKKAKENATEVLRIKVEYRKSDKSKFTQLGEEVVIPFSELPARHRLFKIGGQSKHGHDTTLVVSADWYKHFKLGSEGAVKTYTKKNASPLFKDKGNSEAHLLQTKEKAEKFQVTIPLQTVLLS